MPRFLLHRIIFDHGLIDGLGPDQPRQQGNLLPRKDWIQLRRIALSEWVILPVQEVAAYPWCSECEHLRSGTCPEERRAKWAHVGWSPWHRCANKIDGPCARCPDSSSDSEPEHRLWDLDEAGGCCRSVVGHSLSQFQPGLPLQGPPPQSLWFPQGVTLPVATPHLGIHFAQCSVEPMRARSILAQDPAESRWLPSRGKSGSRTGSPGEEFACACRPLGTHQGRKRYNLGGSCGTARPRRWCPRSGQSRWPPEFSSRRHSQSNGTEHPTQSGERSETNNSPLHVTSLPSSHHVTPRTQPLSFLTSCQCNFLQTWVARFLRSASYQPGHPLNTFGCTQPIERGLSSAPKCRGWTNSNANRPATSRPVSSYSRRGAAVKEIGNSSVLCSSNQATQL